MSSPPAPRGRGCVAWSAGCVAVLMFCALALALFIVAFYAEENWRGSRAWAKAQAELKAHGENLDPTEFIPASVPENVNFGALPYFKEVMVSSPLSSQKSSRLAITQDLKNITDNLPTSQEAATKPGGLPYLGFWQKGETCEAGALEKQLQAFGHQQNPEVKFPADATPSEAFAFVCPLLRELRGANATHPECLFERNYGLIDPVGASFGPDIDQIRVTRVLLYDERLAIVSHRPQQVLDDLKVTWKIYSGLRKEAVRVTGLVTTGVVTIQMQAVNEGLADHLWDDRQLADLDSDLGRIDSLSNAQFCLRGETVRFGIPVIDDYSSHRNKWMMETLIVRPMSNDESAWKTVAIKLTYWIIPQGWFEQNKAAGVLEMMERATTVDPVSRRVYPERGKSLQSSPNDDPGSRWIDSLMVSDDRILGYLKKFVYLQTQLDEARISCRLERYRLVHGTYPASLEKLSPTYGADLPRDIMNGTPYHYRLNPDQTYLLYSVGWDQKDDGGNAGTTRNSDSPDWIWTSYPSLRPTK